MGMPCFLSKIEQDMKCNSAGGYVPAISCIYTQMEPIKAKTKSAPCDSRKWVNFNELIKKFTGSVTILKDNLQTFTCA